MPHAASKPCLVRNPYRTRTMKNEEIGPLARVQTSFHDTTQSGSRPALNFTWTNSLIIPCYSLLRRKNSLFRRVGNLQKKRPFFGKIAGSRWPKIGLNRENSLYFPCITGNFTWRRVRARLLPPPRFNILILQCFSGFWQSGISTSSRGFRASRASARWSQETNESPVWGSNIPNISFRHSSGTVRAAVPLLASCL
jgi:hypothetical protein